MSMYMLYSVYRAVVNAVSPEIPPDNDGAGMSGILFKLVLRPCTYFCIVLVQYVSKIRLKGKTNNVLIFLQSLSISNAAMLHYDFTPHETATKFQRRKPKAGLSCGDIPLCIIRDVHF